MLRKVAQFKTDNKRMRNYSFLMNFTFLLLLLMILSPSVKAQLSNAFIKKHGIHKITSVSASTRITKYGSHGYMVSSENVGDTSIYGKETYDYQFDFLGQVLNKVTYNRDGKITEVSVFRYYEDQAGPRFKDKSIKEYKINMCNSQMDTLVYSEKKLLLFCYSSPGKAEYFYDDKNTLIRRTHTSGGNTDSFNYQPSYDQNGRLIRIEEKDALGSYYIIREYAYDQKGKVIKQLIFETKNPDQKTETKFYYE